MWLKLPLLVKDLLQISQKLYLVFSFSMKLKKSLQTLFITNTIYCSCGHYLLKSSNVKINFPKFKTFIRNFINYKKTISEKIKKTIIKNLLKKFPRSNLQATLIQNFISCISEVSSYKQ